MEGRHPAHPTLHLAISILNMALMLAAMVFYFGVDHQRILALEDEHKVDAALIQRLSEQGTAIRIDSIDQRLERIERKLDAMK